jgi:hypothetical protein
MDSAYYVRDWPAIYETADTVRTQRTTYVPTPNKHDGLGYRRITAEPDGVDLFAAWNLFVQVASRSRGKHQRGWLVRDGQALTAEDIAVMTGFPQRIFDRGLEFFSDPKQGWLESRPLAECPQDGTDARASDRPVAPDNPVPSGDVSGVHPDISGGVPPRSGRHPDASGWPPDRPKVSQSALSIESIDNRIDLQIDPIESNRSSGTAAPGATGSSFPDLFARILETTREANNRQTRAHWEQRFRLLGAQGLESQVSATRDRMRDGGVRNAAAYLTKACDTEINRRKQLDRGVAA